MKIVYISNSRIPTEKAYGVSIVKTCEALAKNGAEAALFVPRVKNTAGKDIFSYYGVEKNFFVRYIPTVDAVRLGWKYGFLINQISFGLAAFFLYKGDKRRDVIITRDEFSGWLLSLLGHKVFYDIHGFPESRLWLWKIALKKMAGIIATNEWKMGQCARYFGTPKEKMVLARNGFDPKLFSSTAAVSKESLREKLNLPQDKPIVLYTGHLYDWKGAYVLLETARNFQFSIFNFQMPLFVFVGGTPWDVEKFKKDTSTLSNVLVLGQKPYTEIPLYLKSADVLALPNSGAPGKDPRLQVYSQKDTSPIKTFEYMASGVPIAASALPSIREILNEKNSILVAPDDPDALRDGIQKILSDKSFAENIAERALYDSKQYTWDARAKIILEFVAWAV